MRFSDLHLIPALSQAVTELGYEHPTPIQQRAIPAALEGRDILGCAQTGTGKTAAFALPILHHLTQHPVEMQGRRTPQALIVAPTRELAAQIAESFVAYGKHLRLRTAVIFGGVGQKPQEDELRRGVDILVACPGRLLDLMQQNHVDLSKVRHLVLDEADRMLDMGFLPDIKRIVAKVPRDRQTLFFSATMPSEIRELVGNLLHDPITVEVAVVSSAAETVEQFVMHVTRDDKVSALVQALNSVSGRTIVFTRTKHGADRVVRKIGKDGIVAAAIHGDKSQGARTKALEGFRSGKIPVLIASDIAARGLDIDEIHLVVNYDIPADPETYVHRIGRTGRAGSRGKAITFVTFDDAEALRDVEKLLARRIPVLKLSSMDSTVSQRSVAPIPGTEIVEFDESEELLEEDTSNVQRGEVRKKKRRRNRNRGSNPEAAASGDVPTNAAPRSQEPRSAPRGQDRNKPRNDQPSQSQRNGQGRNGQGKSREGREQAADPRAVRENGRSNADRRGQRGAGERTSQESGRRDRRDRHGRPVRESNENSSRNLPSGKIEPKLSQGESLIGRIWSRFTKR